MEKPLNTPKIIFKNIQENPCGNICEPFNKNYCILNGIEDPLIKTANSLINRVDNREVSNALAQTMCRVLVEVLNTKQIYNDNEESAEFWKGVADNLTKDKLTGLLTGNGLEAVLNELYDSEFINKIISKNYRARIVYADINDLKKHNSGPGGHEQGDLAIAEIGKAISKYMKSGRRKSIPESRNLDRRNSFHVPRVIAARSNNKGDEFFIMSLHNTHEEQANPRGLKLAKVSLDNLLSCMCYEYEGVEYEVSATFGITEVKLPESKKELKRIISALDVAMMDYKKIAKQGGNTMGVVVDIE